MIQPFSSSETGKTPTFFVEEVDKLWFGKDFDLHEPWSPEMCQCLTCRFVTVVEIFTIQISLKFKDTHTRLVLNCFDGHYQTRKL